MSAQAAAVGTGCKWGLGAQADDSSLGRRRTSVVPLRWPATPAPRSFLAVRGVGPPPAPRAENVSERQA